MKTPDADLLRCMIGFAAERPVNLEIGTSRMAEKLLTAMIQAA